MEKLIQVLESKLRDIIDENGYQEMADGFKQALIIVKKHIKKELEGEK